jgi:hypothetical protein
VRLPDFLPTCAGVHRSPAFGAFWANAAGASTPAVVSAIVDAIAKERMDTTISTGDELGIHERRSNGNRRTMHSIERVNLSGL